MGDTLKAQHTHKLALGNVLYSDRGRPLLSIIGDNFGWHDTICGPTNAVIEATYGLNDFQLARNDYYRNGRDGSYGARALGPRAPDLVPNANFFSTVTVDDEGNIALSKPAISPAPGLLRAERPRDPQHGAPPSEVAYEGEIEAGVFWAGEVPASDVCRTACGENHWASGARPGLP